MHFVINYMWLRPTKNMDKSYSTKRVLVAMKKATDEVLDDYAAKDPLFKEVLESQRTFQRSAREWTRMSEQYYLQETEKVSR